MLRVAVFLVLGAIVNVAVAWGLHLWQSIPYNNGWRAISDHEANRIWNRFGLKFAGLTESLDLDGEARGNLFITDVEVGIEPDGVDRIHPGQVINELQVGLPLRCFCGQFDFEGAVHGFLDTSQWRWATTGSSYQNLVPSHPLWPGFAINTIFYAAILWATFAAPFAFRRRRRIKRGLCPACAYPVGVSDVCTECGSSITGRIAAHVAPPRRAGVATRNPRS